MTGTDIGFDDLRVLRHGGVWPLRQHLAARQHGDGVGEIGDDGHVVLDHQHGAVLRDRADQLGDALELLRSKKKAETPVLFIRAAGTDEAKVVATTLGAADASVADMRTLVIIGASTTRQVGRWVYTPRGERVAS